MGASVSLNTVTNLGSPPSSSRILCFGGTFNPIHHGHLICARAVAEAKGYDRIAIIPTSNPPHKEVSADRAPAEDRLKMCQLAVEDSRRSKSKISNCNGPARAIQSTRFGN